MVAEDRDKLLLLYRAIATGDCRAWNNFRIENPDFRHSLIGLELRRLRLPHINLSRLDMQLARFDGTCLFRANFQGADLTMAVLANSDLRGANLRNAKLFLSNLEYADLRGADLTRADLRRANLKGALLEGADFTGATLDPAHLGEEEYSPAQHGVTRLEKLFLLVSRSNLTRGLYPVLLRARKSLSL